MVRPATSLLRRVSRVALSSGLFSTEGSFIFCAGGRRQRVSYDARNLQFKALYDPKYRNGYELETSLLMRKLCHGGGAFFDVGANWGYFSLLVASFFPIFTAAFFHSNQILKASVT